MQKPFSSAKKVGNMIFVSGQIPKNPQTGKWGTNIIEQTKICLDRIKSILTENGAKVSDIVKTTVFLTNMDHYADMNETYVQFFKENNVTMNFPARSVVEVGRLMYSEWYIELDCVAVLSN
jgi:2-iminobutanoate/2-iminopropanoate deaminase